MCEGCSASGGVDLLPDVGVSKLWPERIVVANLVAVAVGGDGARGFEPCGLLSGFVGFGAEPCRPRFTCCDGLVEQCGGASFDQVLTFGECLAHVGAHWPAGSGDESGDQAWWFAGATGFAAMLVDFGSGWI